jgi:hypothetical protein
MRRRPAGGIRHALSSLIRSTSFLAFLHGLLSLPLPQPSPSRRTLSKSEVTHFHRIHTAQARSREHDRDTAHCTRGHQTIPGSQTGTCQATAPPAPTKRVEMCCETHPERQSPRRLAAPGNHVRGIAPRRDAGSSWPPLLVDDHFRFHLVLHRFPTTEHRFHQKFTHPVNSFVLGPAVINTHTLANSFMHEQGKQAHPVLKYRVPHRSQPRPGWSSARGTREDRRTLC